MLNVNVHVKGPEPPPAPAEVPRRLRRRRLRRFPRRLPRRFPRRAQDSRAGSRAGPTPVRRQRERHPVDTLDAQAEGGLGRVCDHGRRLPRLFFSTPLIP